LAGEGGAVGGEDDFEIGGGAGDEIEAGGGDVGAVGEDGADVGVGREATDQDGVDVGAELFGEEGAVGLAVAPL
jgi:hypothetical protein